MRWFAFILLALAIIAQGGYLVMTYPAATRDLVWRYDLWLTVAFAVLFVFYGRARWLGGILRLGLGLIFAVSAFDRLGLIARLNGPIAHWKDLAHVISFASKVPAAFITSLAHPLPMVSLVLEGLLAVTLIVGIGTRFFSIIALLLLLCYSAIIVLTSGPISLLYYAMPVFCTGTLALATIDATALGIDKIRGRREPPRDPFLLAFDQAREAASRFRSVKT